MFKARFFLPIVCFLWTDTNFAQTRAHKKSPQSEAAEQAAPEFSDREVKIIEEVKACVEVRKKNNEWIAAGQRNRWDYSDRLVSEFSFFESRPSPFGDDPRFFEQSLKREALHSKLYSLVKDDARPCFRNLVKAACARSERLYRFGLADILRGKEKRKWSPFVFDCVTPATPKPEMVIEYLQTMFPTFEPLKDGENAYRESVRVLDELRPLILTDSDLGSQVRSHIFRLRESERKHPHLNQFRKNLLWKDAEQSKAIQRWLLDVHQSPEVLTAAIESAPDEILKMLQNPSQNGLWIEALERLHKTVGLPFILLKSVLDTKDPEVYRRLVDWTVNHPDSKVRDQVLKEQDSYGRLIPDTDARDMIFPVAEEYFMQHPHLFRDPALQKSLLAGFSKNTIADLFFRAHEDSKDAELSALFLKILKGEVPNDPDQYELPLLRADRYKRLQSIPDIEIGVWASYRELMQPTNVSIKTSWAVVKPFLSVSDRSPQKVAEALLKAHMQGKLNNVEAIDSFNIYAINKNYVERGIHKLDLDSLLLPVCENAPPVPPKDVDWFNRMSSYLYLIPLDVFREKPEFLSVCMEALKRHYSDDHPNVDTWLYSKFRIFSQSGVWSLVKGDIKFYSSEEPIVLSRQDEMWLLVDRFFEEANAGLIPPRSDKKFDDQIDFRNLFEKIVYNSLSTPKKSQYLDRLLKKAMQSPPIPAVSDSLLIFFKFAPAALEEPIRALPPADAAKILSILAKSDHWEMSARRLRDTKELYWVVERFTSVLQQGGVEVLDHWSEVPPHLLPIEAVAAGMTLKQPDLAAIYREKFKFHLRASTPSDLMEKLLALTKASKSEDDAVRILLLQELQNRVRLADIPKERRREILSALVKMSESENAQLSDLAGKLLSNLQ